MNCGPKNERGSLPFPRAVCMTRKMGAIGPWEKAPQATLSHSDSCHQINEGRQLVATDSTTWSFSKMTEKPG